MSAFCHQCLCGTFFFAASEDDLRMLRETHQCFASRATTQAFGFDKPPDPWLTRLTVGDAAFLHSLKIDPL